MYVFLFPVSLKKHDDLATDNHAGIHGFRPDDIIICYDTARFLHGEIRNGILYIKTKLVLKAKYK